MRHSRHVLGEDVAAKISVEVPPDGMNVVAVVLRVVVFDQERRALHLILILVSFLRRAGPGEHDGIGARRLDFRKARRRDE